VDPGELVSPTVPVLTVVNIDEVVIETGASEQQVNHLGAGREVKVLITAVKAEALVGHISSISPSADPRTKTYAVKVKVANQDRLIKPGMFAEIDLGVAEEVILVPRDTVVTRGDRTAVFVVEENKAVLRKVKTGPSDGRNIAVLEGIEQGERVVTSGQERLNDGTRVRVVEGTR
jgi:RND family efflux transporter MFP subunit